MAQSKINLIEADCLLADLFGMAEATYLAGCGMEALDGSRSGQAAAIIALGKRMSDTCDDLRAVLWPQPESEEEA